MSKILVCLLAAFIATSFAIPRLAFAQYGAAPIEGQVLGETASEGIPAFYLSIALGLITLSIAGFFYFKRFRSQ